MRSAVGLLLLLAAFGLVKTQILTNKSDEGIADFKALTDKHLGILQQFEARLERLERLEIERADKEKTRVAFSASLVDYVESTHEGPFDNATRLIFMKVSTNMGNAYDPTTGIFTAPVAGVYYIRFTGCVGQSGSMNAALIKDGENMMAIFDTRGTHGSASNGMPLILDQGAQLWINLWAQQSIFDQSRRSTFSGFLLYPL